MKLKIVFRILSLIILTSIVIATFAYFGAVKYKHPSENKKDAVRLTELKLGQNVRNGDILFHTSKSYQSKAIQLATNSKYSHMGIIYENHGQFFVYEAVQPVKLTPIIEWINRGENGHYVIKRLKNADQVLTKSTLAQMKQIGKQFEGKSYDIYFEWTDDKIYCSELVWKIYKQATGIEIGQLEQLSDFDLTSTIVKTNMKARYGNTIPLNMKVISPAAMFNSDKLITIETN